MNPEITEEEFQAYDDIRRSGVTNMMAIENVQRLTGLSREKILAIMKQYGELRKKYLKES